MDKELMQKLINLWVNSIEEIQIHQCEDCGHDVLLGQCDITGIITKLQNSFPDMSFTEMGDTIVVL